MCTELEMKDDEDGTIERVNKKIGVRKCGG